MKKVLAIFIFCIALYSCRTATKEESAHVDNDTAQLESNMDFIGEYYNPSQIETLHNGLRIKLLIRKDSIANQYLLNFSTDASKNNDSCKLQTKAVKRNDTLFTYITTGIDSALMYVTILPHGRKKVLDVFTTEFKNKDVLSNFCIGNASLIGNYQIADKPSSLTDSTQRSLGFIRSLVDKKATETRLFQFAHIRERLTLLLGKSEFETLTKNWIVEQPFEQKQDEIYKVSACKTNRCNIYKTNIFFDIPNDNITVIITQKGETTINTEKPSLQLPPVLIEEIKNDSK